MNLTPEHKAIGRQNFQDAVGVSVSRRAFLKTAAAAPALGAFYFGYDALKGSPVKTGFIGTGDEGSVLLTQHPPEYMDIVAVADLRPTNLKRAFFGDGNENRVGLIKKLGHQTAGKIKRYTDHKQLLADPEIEAVVIAVPLNVHADLTIEALRAGKHVLCEKLMAHNITQCKEMIRVAKETGKLLAVGHQRHYSVLYDNAADLIRQGVLGDIKFIRACWHRNNSFPGSDSWLKKIADDDQTLASTVSQYGFDSLEQLINWRLYNKTGGGLMAELGSHQLDAASIFLGAAAGERALHPIAVMGYGGRNFYGVEGVGSKDKQADKREIDDHVYVTLEFPGPHYKDDQHDVTIVTYSSINTNRFEPYGETVMGSRGTMITELEQNVMLWKEAGGDTGGGGPGQRLRVVQEAAGGGGAVLSASPSLAPATGGGAAGGAGPDEKVSRGYTEEMEHLCWCIRNDIPQDAPITQGGLRCPGKHAMADAIMAITCNLAMKHKKRIVFKEEWFDPDSPAAPETDPEVIG
ncbi:MAG: Gfo/Idh/MocA family oxidoreductase [Planctomycetaceae bacterium]|nr:Gfo/Idh/MocA family oxidoreductase [Planctomycetaceae bacterium]